MKHLIIIGASGFSRDMYSVAKESVGYMETFDIKGFLVHKKEYLNSLDGYSGYPPVLGTIYDYEIQIDDVFVIALGDVSVKHEVGTFMSARGAEFLTLVHRKAELRNNVTLGKGCIIESHAHIGSDVTIGENCLIQAFACVAHDCEVGDYSRLDVRVLMTGGSKVGKNVTIHSNAVVNQKITIGDNATVAALSFVIRNVKSGTTVMGNPAKRLEY